MDYGKRKFILHKESLEMSNIDDEFYKVLHFYSEPYTFIEANSTIGLLKTQFVELINLHLISLSK